MGRLQRVMETQLALLGGLAAEGAWPQAIRGVGVRDLELLDVGHLDRA